MTPHPARSRRMIAVVVAALAVTWLLAACGDDDEPATTGDTTDETAETDDEAAPAIEVTGAWARTSPASAANGAVYLSIANGGDADDALVGAAVDASVAATTETHKTVAVEPDDAEGEVDGGMTTETGMDGDAGDMGGDMGGSGGMMEMRPVDEIVVPAGGSVDLEPGGYHIMLLDLVEPLEVGATIDVTLTFETAGEVVVTAEVRDQAP